MHVCLSRTDFLAALGRVKPLANKFGLVQLAAAADGTLTLTTADATRHLQDHTPATVTEPGTASARAALLFDLVRLAEGADVILRLAPPALIVECGRARHELAQRSGEPDLPPLPVLPSDAATFTVEDSALRGLLAQTAAAVSTDPVRHILCGVSVRLGAGQLEVAGCDGRRLSVGTCACPVPGTLSFILPSPTVRDLLRFLGTDCGAPAALQVAVQDRRIRFRLGTLTLVSALIEGEYPDYRRIIPEAEAVASLSRVELVSALEALALVADAVTLEFGASQLVLRSHGSRGTERLGTATATLPVAAQRVVTGTYSVQLLRETLAAAPAENIEFCQNPSGTALLRGAPDWCGVVSALTPQRPPSAAAATNP